MRILLVAVLSLSACAAIGQVPTEPLADMDATPAFTKNVWEFKGEKVSDLGFIRPNPPARRDTDATAACVRTSKPWEGVPARETVAFSWPAVRY